MEFINSTFGSVKELSPFGFAIRTVFVGFLLWAEGKVLPYRSGGQFAGYDFAFFWMMGGITAAPLFEPKISFINAVVIIIVIYLLHYLFSYLAVKNRTFARIVLGQSIVLIDRGKLLRKNMRKGLFPLELLFSELRTVDAPNIHEVEAAVLETSGHVSVIRKADAQPATPRELNLPTIPGGLPVILINDGVVQKKNLNRIGYDEAWLKQQLQNSGISQTIDVYLASIDPAGNFYCSVK
jgi:uncharacterized membrane protein YcaP (DUF421 family)